MIYLLIPSYNDSDNFSLLLLNITHILKREKFKIIIVNDGSTDGTKKIAKELSKKYPLSLIGYKKNKGPGYAFRYGFEYLIPKLKEQDIVITMEADNSSDFSIIEKMIKKSEKFDVVLSSPFASKGQFIGLDLKRKVLGIIAMHLDRIIFRIKNVKTYSSFYRLYKAPMLKKSLNHYGKNLIRENGFPAVIELLIKLNKLNATVCEVPARLDWSTRRGKSKMKISKTVIRHLAIYKNFMSGKYSV